MNSGLEFETVEGLYEEPKNQFESSLFMNTDAINEILSSITRGFQKMEELNTEILREFSGKIKYDLQKDKQIDRLHDELEAYRDNLVLKSIMPILEDIIFEIESNKKRMRALKENKDVPKDKLFKIIEDYTEDLSSILFRQGIESYSTVEDNFDGKIHRASKIVFTEDIYKDNIVCDSLRCGYRWDDKIIKKEVVNIYKYKKAESFDIEEEIIYG